MMVNEVTSAINSNETVIISQNKERIYIYEFFTTTTKIIFGENNLVLCFFLQNYTIKQKFHGTNNVQFIRLEKNTIIQ